MPASIRDKDTAALHLAAIVEWSDDAIVSKDLSGIVTSWNRAAERMFGYTADEIVGRSIRTIIPDDRQTEEDEVLRRVLAGLTVDHFPTVRRRKDGTLIDISLTVSPIRNADGIIVGASKIARDITEQKRAAAELEEMQGRLLALVDASGSLLQSPKVDAVLTATMAIARDQLTADGYALWRADSGGAWRAVRSLGISSRFAERIVQAEAPGAPLGMAPFAEPLVIEDVSKVTLVSSQIEAYRAEGIHSMLVFPLAIRPGHGATIVFYYRTPRAFNAVEVRTGRVLANLTATAVATAELYDQQHAYREEAEQGRQRAAFLADAGAVLSASLDYEKTLATVAGLAVPHIADWCTVDVLDDRGRLQRLGIAHVDPAKVEMARTLRERYPEEPNAKGGVHEVIRSGRPVMMANIPPALIETAVQDDEHRRVLRALALRSYMCVPLAARGRTFGAMTFVMAESGRRYTEEDLRFGQEVAARAALAVENARAYQRVNEASRIKDEFLGTLSHELRTPLNAILGYARMLRWGLIDHERDKAVEIIERNAASLNQIIEDVLDVSRIVAGKLRLNVQPLRLQDVVEHCIASVLPAANAKNVRVEKILDQFAGNVSGDGDRLQQVVWNLLTNAVKFTPKGGRVQVRLERVNSHVEVIVSDTGPGISADFLPFIFERFRQAESGFGRNHGGLGLGLAIVREIVEMHGGTVAAESDGAGTGATFRVKLPLMIVHQGQQPHGPRVHPTAAAYARQSPDGHRLDGVRVLAVDDEQDSLSLLQAILAAAGADVRTVASASNALDEMERDVPDVLVTDLGMPGMDGLALIRRVRQSPNPRVQAVPALALTAYARSEDRVTALASGFHMHVAKPADPTELVVAVASLVRRRVA